MPDVNKKYVLKVGEGRFDVDSEVRDLGDEKLSGSTITGKSGVISQTINPQVKNPVIRAIGAVITPEKETATITAIGAVITPEKETATITSVYTTGIT